MRRRKTTVQVRDRMSRSPVTVGPEDSLQSALDLLGKHNIRELPVVDHGKLVGIVTDRDLRQVSPSYPVFRDPEEIDHYLKNLRVASAMTPDPLVVAPAISLVEAAELLVTYRIGALPVVEEERLVGIISVTDVLQHYIEQYAG